MVFVTFNPVFIPGSTLGVLVCVFVCETKRPGAAILVSHRGKVNFPTASD